MRALGFCQRLEPVGNFFEAFVARAFGHARIHIRVFVRLAGNGGCQILAAGADRQAGGRIAHLLQVFEVAVRVAGFAFGGRTKHRGDVVLAFDISLVGEIKITAVSLGFAGERSFQIFLGFRALEFHGSSG